MNNQVAMLQLNQFNPMANLYVGLIVDYFPSPSERYAAIVTNYHNPKDIQAAQSDTDLQVFQPNGKISHYKAVPYVDREDRIGDDSLKISDHWGFAHEFPVEQEAAHDPLTEQGIHSNAYVGQLNNQWD